MLRKPEIIGLAGRKGHGKDTVAKLLEPMGYTVIRFADPLKNMLRMLLVTGGATSNFIESCIEGPFKQQPVPELGGKSPRHALQTLGTEWGRACMGEDFWVEQFNRRAGLYDKVVVPDVRFPNECDIIRKSGGKVFRVDAGARVPHDEFSTHSSETEIDRLPVDGVIDNSGLKSSILKQIQRVMQLNVDVRQAEM
jgi:hypothetical protein